MVPHHTYLLIFFSASLFFIEPKKDPGQHGFNASKFMTDLERLLGVSSTLPTVRKANDTVRKAKESRRVTWMGGWWSGGAGGSGGQWSV